MKGIYLVMVGGAIGSLCRYLVALWTKGIYGGSFPWHTLAVNLSGCFIIGMFLAWPAGRHSPESINLFFMVGVLGGFTTFSSFGLETFDMFRNKLFVEAAFYILASNVFGISFVFLGYQLIKTTG